MAEEIYKISEPRLFLRIYVEIPITIKVKTGLFIGGLETDIADNPIIKDKEGYPYIPGSSLKGRIRSIVEFIEGKIYIDEALKGNPRNPEKFYKRHNIDMDPRKIYEDKIARTFGYAPKNVRVFGPTRVIFEDFKVEEKKGSPLDIIELKIENMIDRVRGTAENPRIVERVVPGTQFKGKVKVLGFDVVFGENHKCAENEVLEAIELIAKGLARLNRVGIGGKISRGYGQVEVKVDPKGINVHIAGHSAIEACRVKVDLRDKIVDIFKKEGVLKDDRKRAQ